MSQVMAKFDGYTLRTVDEDDYPALDAWIAGDPWHNGIFDPEFFMGKEQAADGRIAEDPRATCFALEDENGALFFIRLSRASRVHIQFNPESNRKKVATALIKGMALLEVGLSKAGAEEWVFETGEARLALLARKHLGFHESPNELVRKIERLAPAEQGRKS